MTDTTAAHQPHPYLGGRAAALRTLAAWRAGTADAPRTVLITGDSGSGRTRLLTAFLMLSDPAHRARIDTTTLDPATVPPADLPAPPVLDATGLTAVQLRWLLADTFAPGTDRSEHLPAVLAGLGTPQQPQTVVVADIDRAGLLTGTDEAARITTEVLLPLALNPGVRLLADLPRTEADRLAKDVPAGQLRILDLDQDPWRDPDALLRQAELAVPDLTVARQLAAVADSPLVVRLAGWSVQAHPAGPLPLPRSAGDALDLHAERCGNDELTLRRLLAPLALAGPGEPLPFDLWGPVASAVAGKDLGPALAAGRDLLLPFFDLASTAAGTPGARIVHPAVADEIRERLGRTAREVHRRIATALLATVPGGHPRRWAAAAPYVREQLAGHALHGGLLDQLLTDPGFLLHAEQHRLRAAVDRLAADPTADLPPLGRTWLRLAPLFTRQELDVELRAALLDHAACQDGLPSLDTTGLDVPWHTLWARPLTGVDAVTAAVRPDGSHLLVAHHPGREPELTAYDARTGEADHTDPGQLARPDGEQRAAGALALSIGSDYVRLWQRGADGAVTGPSAAFLSAAPLAGADLTPDGLLLIADAHGVSVLRPAVLSAEVAAHPVGP
ncbi:ATP-binding protein [Kitasatospora sp. CB02891]|uniref:ATP-binding protein n=1 Tax=Kitasatospora sp. CB02891 TaxID=2020329 RepID=UPI0012FD923B|nr:ATP-binding protein [Kitasatospora sp. CB02891]